MPDSRLISPKTAFCHHATGIAQAIWLPQVVCGDSGALAVAESLGLRAWLRRWVIDRSLLQKRWRIGLITGPSGSGKTTLGRALFPDAPFLSLPEQTEHPLTLFELVGDMPMDDRARWLSRCGIGSARQWFCPLHHLSEGQKAIASMLPMFRNARGYWIADDFGHLLDPTSRALLAVSIRSRLLIAESRRGHAATESSSDHPNPNHASASLRLIVTSSDPSLAKLLKPDWVLDSLTGTLARPEGQTCESAARPDRPWQIDRTDGSWWPMFAHAHDLVQPLHPSARCYLASWSGLPAGFIATLPVAGHAGCRRISRLVVHPICQGLGLGSYLLDQVARIESASGRRVFITLHHPGMIGSLLRKRRWKLSRRRRGRRHSGVLASRRPAAVEGIRLWTFVYVGEESKGRDSCPSTPTLT